MVPGAEGQAGPLRPFQNEGNNLIGDLENQRRLNGCSGLFQRIYPERGGPRSKAGQGVVGGPEKQAGGIRLGQFEQDAHAVGPRLHRAGELASQVRCYPTVGFERRCAAQRARAANSARVEAPTLRSKLAT